MHQLPRQTPRSTNSASNPITNLERSNNPRDRSSVDLTNHPERAVLETPSMAGRAEGSVGSSQDKEKTKLNQIIQHFHTKAALMICSSRANLPQVQNQNGEIRQNRWFNVLIDETDVLVNHLQEWKRPDLTDVHPRPLVVETYFDSAHLTNNQLLVVKDVHGKRFDVANALNSSAAVRSHPTKSGARYCEVVLERWTIELGDSSGYSPAELDDNLPNVYKKGVVLFRSLYTLLRLLPAFKLHRKLLRQTGSQHALKLKFRIRSASSLDRRKDSLIAPLCPTDLSNSDNIVEHHEFGPLLTALGPLHCSLDYRKACEFGVADAEALMSDHFYGLDEGLPGIPIGRSLPSNRSEQVRERYSSTVAPTATTSRERPRALLGAYGSLGTFHSTNKRISPVSELRQRAIEDDREADMSQPGKVGDDQNIDRRQSVDYIANPPFKAGSLTSSPRPSPLSSPRPPPSPSSSLGRNEGQFPRHRSTPSASDKRISLNALPQQQLRTPSGISEAAMLSSTSPSSRPTSVRYSSSFANRTKRFPSQSSKAAESNTSSGRGSSDSKEKSEHLNELVQGSMSSAHTDEDDITSFISDLERSKAIKFHTPPNTRDNVVNLAKYSNMREHAQLADEMSSSSLIQASSTPSSRRLSNVPGLSTSSSPSRAVTHVPHVRSRLSAQSVAEEPSSASAASGESSTSPKVPLAEEDDDEPFIFPHHQNDYP